MQVDTSELPSPIGRGILAANDFAARAMVHPIDTFGTPEKRGAALREGMRGVNANIPFANDAVEAMGGPAAESPADAAAAPGAQAFGNVAGIPVGGAVGDIAAHAVAPVAGAIGRGVQQVARGAGERIVGRTKDALEMGANKTARGGLRTDVVDDVIRENPAIAKAAGDDKKLAQVTEEIHSKAAHELGPIYGQVAPLEDIAAPITNMDKRIGALEQGTASDRAVAKKLQAIRDEMNTAYGKRGAVSVQDLRAEQTAYQKKGYGKAMPGDEAATAAIAANREASKAVGDAVVNHVTGMDYAAAKAAAAADPNSLAARLFKANDQISAANKIEAGIADRASKVKPDKGFAAKVTALAHGMKHAGAAGVAAAASHYIHPAVGAAIMGADVIHSAMPMVGRAVDPMIAKLVKQGIAEQWSPAKLAAAISKAAPAENAATNLARAGSRPSLPRGLVSKTQIAGDAPGLIEPGNVDLTNRPDVANPDGSHSSVRSMSFQDEPGGPEILVPTVSDDGRIMTDDEAIAQYHRTGRHLGKFKSPDLATQYAGRLHEQQASNMGMGS
jgi:hypothetical protein